MVDKLVEAFILYLPSIEQQRQHGRAVVLRVGATSHNLEASLCIYYYYVYFKFSMFFVL